MVWCGVVWCGVLVRCLTFAVVWSDVWCAACGVWFVAGGVRRVWSQKWDVLLGGDEGKSASYGSKKPYTTGQAPSTIQTHITFVEHLLDTRYTLVGHLVRTGVRACACHMLHTHTHLLVTCLTLVGHVWEDRTKTQQETQHFQRTETTTKSNHFSKIHNI